MKNQDFVLTPEILHNSPVAKIQRDLQHLDRANAAHESLIADALLLEQDHPKPRATVVLALQNWLHQSGPLTPAESDLNQVAKGINTGLDTIETIIEGARRQSLPHALQIGALCIAAHAKFAVSDHSKRGKMKSLSRRDKLTFDGWVEEACPRLKRATAYKYMNAVRGLGLGAGATLTDITAALEPLGNVTLNELINAAKAPLNPPQEPPAPLAQSVFPFMREYRLAGEQVIAMKDHMDDQAYKTAVARTYEILHQLTGQHWSPSEKQPDAIDLALLEGTGL